jgi:hypothetical protein
VKEMKETKGCDEMIDEASREGERESERDGFFFNKKSDWEAIVLPNVLGSIVATQPKHVNMGCLL